MRFHDLRHEATSRLFEKDLRLADEILKVMDKSGGFSAEVGLVAKRVGLSHGKVHSIVNYKIFTVFIDRDDIPMFIVHLTVENLVISPFADDF